MFVHDITEICRARQSSLFKSDWKWLQNFPPHAVHTCVNSQIELYHAYVMSSCDYSVAMTHKMYDKNIHILSDTNKYRLNNPMLQDEIIHHT